MKPINLHGIGSHVTPQGIAKLLVPKVLQHRAAGRDFVIACIDREQREQATATFSLQVSRAVTAELRQGNHATDNVMIVVADRAFEAWILADALGFHARGRFTRAPNFHCFEGELGQQGRKGVMELTMLLGRSYQKTQDGVRLFAELDFQAARNHVNHGRGSASLDRFLRALGV